MSDLTPRPQSTPSDPPRGSGPLGATRGPFVAHGGPALGPVVIQATGLHKRFTEGSGADALDVHVLQGVDLTVRRGAARRSRSSAPRGRARAPCCT